MAEAVRDNGLPETTLIANDHEEPPDFLVSEDTNQFVRYNNRIITSAPIGQKPIVYCDGKPMQN